MQMFQLKDFRSWLGEKVCFAFEVATEGLGIQETKMVSYFALAIMGPDQSFFRVLTKFFQQYYLHLL